MSMRPTEAARFPSHADLERLRQLCANWDSKHEKITGLDLEKLSDADRWLWHAYKYGFRRVALQTRDDAIPTDLGNKWLNHDLAVQAEVFWSKDIGVPVPPLPEPYHQPSAEEIRHVEVCCRKIRTNLKTFVFNATKPFRGTP